MAKTPIRKRPGISSHGFSAELANSLNRQQATKVQHKMAAKQVRTPKKGQGFTQHRPGVDHL